MRREAASAGTQASSRQAAVWRLAAGPEGAWARAGRRRLPPMSCSYVFHPRRRAGAGRVLEDMAGAGRRRSESSGRGRKRPEKASQAEHNGGGGAPQGEPSQSIWRR
ncbi:uncharacterized protein LOC142987288 [Anticarsia gemmatalis]|uniref:uncharacterized protein LOC142987288 n=1 Tax=Anticarsia gemmatalis TaxID=129554 RepID=UPI003F776E89